MMSGILNLTNQPTTMTPKEEVLRALNQLTSLVAGREAAIATNDLSDTPEQRVAEIVSMTSKDLIEAASSGDNKALKQAQRKLESLGSLKLLSEVLINEVDWD